MTYVMISRTGQDDDVRHNIPSALLANVNFGIFWTCQFFLDLKKLIFFRDRGTFPETMNTRNAPSLFHPSALASSERTPNVNGYVRSSDGEPRRVRNGPTRRGDGERLTFASAAGNRS